MLLFCRYDPCQAHGKAPVQSLFNAFPFAITTHLPATGWSLPSALATAQVLLATHATCLGALQPNSLSEAIVAAVLSNVGAEQGGVKCGEAKGSWSFDVEAAASFACLGAEVLDDCKHAHRDKKTDRQAGIERERADGEFHKWTNLMDHHALAGRYSPRAREMPVDAETSIPTAEQGEREREKRQQQQTTAYNTANVSLSHRPHGNNINDAIVLVLLTLNVALIRDLRACRQRSTEEERRRIRTNLLWCAHSTGQWTVLEQHLRR